MIIDLEKFIAKERPYWTRLEAALDRLERGIRTKATLEELKEFHYLYERAASDLGKIMTFSAEPRLRRYLESLVARAYGEIHESREKAHRLSPLAWLRRTLPQTFRRRFRAFSLALGATLVGCLFGGAALALDPSSKGVMMPFSHLQGDPSERVAMEENREFSGGGGHATFSAHLMTHNTKVSITALALGLTWGVGTIVLLFYNGIVLGAVAVDYVAAGELEFLLGWLLPHGVVEIPAILVAGQAGLVLAGALIGWGSRQSLRARMREVTPDLATLIAGAGLMLVWAGLVESYLSQLHEPAIPYIVKIAFGCAEFAALLAYLALVGRSGEATEEDHELA